MFNDFHTDVLRFNLLETVKHNKYVRSQITGCPLYNSTGRHVSVYLDHHQVLRARAYSI